MGWPFDGPILPWEIAQQGASDIIGQVMIIVLASLIFVLGLLIATGKIPLGSGPVRIALGLIACGISILLMAGVIPL
jgi:hypothetical protein